MIGERYIDGDKLLKQIASDALLDEPDLPREAKEAIRIRAEVEKWLKRQPTAPKLIGRQRAAVLLGVTSPYMTHFIDAGLLKPIRVEGGKDAYIEAEVKALAKKREREAKSKAKQEEKI